MISNEDFAKLLSASLHGKLHFFFLLNPSILLGYPHDKLHTITIYIVRSSGKESVGSSDNVAARNPCLNTHSAPNSQATCRGKKKVCFRYRTVLTKTS